MRSMRAFTVGLFLAVLAACGTEGGVVDPDPPVDPTAPITPEARLQALGAVEARFTQLLNAGLTPAAVSQALAASLRERREFAAVGIDETLNVWAEFTDGHLLIVSSDVRPTEDPALAAGADAQAASPARSASGLLPRPATARILHAFRGAHAVERAVADLRGWFADPAVGYSVAPVSSQGDSATVEVLRAVSGDGFLYLNAHGGKGVLRSGDTIYSIQSATLVRPGNEAAYDADLDSLRLTYHTARNGLVNARGDTLTDTRYGITQRFVQRYMSFGDDAVVFLNVCWSTSAHAEPSALLAAFHSRNARTVLGWSRNVYDDHALKAVRYFADRVLGGNRFMAETEPQRPFDVEQVLLDMEGKGLVRDPKSGAILIARPRPGAAENSMLRPSIMRLAPDSSLTVAERFGTMMIHGQFGPATDPGRSVIIRDRGQEVPLSILDWSPDSIRVRLKDRPSDPGFSGDVVVTSHGRKSNPRRLMAYSGPMVYTLRSLGTQTLRVEMDLLARFDPDRVRRAPGEQPAAQMGPLVTRTIPFFLAEARWVASGAGSVQGCTVRWSGSGTMSAATMLSLEGSYFYVGSLDPASRTLASTFDAYAPTRYRTWDCKDESRSDDEFVSASSYDFAESPEGSIRMQIDPQWRIVGATRTATLDGEGSITLQWSTITPMPAFDPAQPK
jgi:hypothetical protein